MFGLLVSRVCVLLTSACSVMGTPPPNDTCADAAPIIGEGLFAFDDSDGVLDDPRDAIANDVWYCWTAPCDGDVTIDTCGGTAVDTIIVVYDGCQCPPMTWLGGDDDACVFQSSVTFTAVAGLDYLIRIGTHPFVRGGSGTFAIHCGTAPVPPCQQAPENCQARDGWNALASNRAEFVVADDFTPAADGDISEICWWGTYYNDAGDPARVVSDSFELRYYIDDGGLPGTLFAGPFSQAESTLSVQGPTWTYQLLADVDPEYEYKATHEPVSVVAGMCYWVEISNETQGAGSWYWTAARANNERAVQDGNGITSPDGYDPQDALVADLAFCLDLPLDDPQACHTVPVNDACINSLPISEGETFFDTTGAMTDGPEEHCLPSQQCCAFPLGDHQVHRDIWFDYVAPCSGLLTARLCESPFDTKVAIYEGFACPPSDAAVACDDDGCSDALAQQSEAELLVTGGQGYKIRVGGYTALLKGDCGIQNETPGCSDSMCEAAVCAVDPSCCDRTRWDSSCAGIANALCAGRSGPGTIQLELTAPPPVGLDLTDYAVFANCVTGVCSKPPCDPPLYNDPCCLVSDFDNDGDVDLDDYAAFLPGLAGP
ncbi:MAG: hypothetical protein JSU86_13010 [Phycisphaerales bacterium]|nr:MAG: hypothetical protein JSU86_13010 [Phycisphaerales bacterium]